MAHPKMMGNYYNTHGILIKLHEDTIYINKRETIHISSNSLVASDSAAKQVPVFDSPQPKFLLSCLSALSFI
jgi:hypothetical protein